MYGREGGDGSMISPKQYLLVLKCMQQHSQPLLLF